MKLKLALFCSLALAGANAMACYTVYDGNNRVIYQGAQAPVDMSRPIHETLGARYPGAHMVFDQSNRCTPVTLAQVARPTGRDVPAGTIRMEGGRQATPTSSSPLLTDRETAERQNLPHTVVAGDVVLVPASAASRARIPSMTVIPSEATLLAQRAPQADAAVLAGAPNTATMGAGPAPGQTVITELRDGSTVVQRSVAVQRR